MARLGSPGSVLPVPGAIWVSLSAPGLGVPAYAFASSHTSFSEAGRVSQQEGKACLSWVPM